MSQIVIVGTSGCKVKDWVSAASRLPLLYRLECLTSSHCFTAGPAAGRYIHLLLVAMTDCMLDLIGGGCVI